MAALAASTVRLSPEATPIPLKLLRFFHNRFHQRNQILTGVQQSNQKYPAPPAASIVCAESSTIGVRFSTTCSRRSLGITKYQLFPSARQYPFLPRLDDARPSKVKVWLPHRQSGLPVRATSAITGAAPVPTAHPAVTNTISAFTGASLTFSAFFCSLSNFELLSRPS